MQPDSLQITQLASRDVGLDYKHVLMTFNQMKDAGSLYRNLEKALGEGEIFVLGQDLPETQ